MLNKRCDKCKGSGYIKTMPIKCKICKGKKCIKCKETGYKISRYSTCNSCYGSGTINKNNYKN